MVGSSFAAPLFGACEKRVRRAQAPGLAAKSRRWTTQRRMFFFVFRICCICSMFSFFHSFINSFFVFLFFYYFFSFFKFFFILICETIHRHTVTYTQSLSLSLSLSIYIYIYRYARIHTHTHTCIHDKTKSRRWAAHQQQGSSTTLSTVKETQIQRPFHVGNEQDV